MAAYPNLTFSPNSHEETLDSLIVDRARNGDLHTRSYMAPRSRFVLEHLQVSQSAKDSYKAFYAANHNLAVTMTWTDLNVYTVRFTSPPRYKPYPNSNGVNTWDITVEVQET